MRIHEIEGGNGVRISVREWGSPWAPPILFIHGVIQSHQTWIKQFQSHLTEQFRLVAVDLRGHGMSEKRLDPENYTTGQYWADDINGIITELDLGKPVIVAGAYGGYVVCDYIEHYGQEDIAGINFVAAAWKNSSDFDMVGPGFYGNAEKFLSADLPTRIEGIRRLLRAAFAMPIDQDLFEIVLANNMVVPLAVIAGCTMRQLDFSHVLSGIEVPVLVSYGSEDTLILPAMSEAILEKVPNARASVYENAGHALAIEAHVRFNVELGSFVEEVSP
jgi:non-heme chloroperoxidase